MTSTTAAAGPFTRPVPDQPDTHRRRTGAAVLVGAAALGAAGERVLTFWHPDLDEGGGIAFDRLHGMQDTWWAMHFFGGVSVIVLVACVALAVQVLTPGRGSAWAAVGGMVLLAGGALFGVGIAAEGTAMTYATQAGEPGRAVLAELVRDPSRFLLGIAPGVLLMTAGTLLAVVALWRAGTAPRVLLGVLTLGTVGGAVVPFGVVPAVGTTLTSSLPLLALVVLAARRLRGGRTEL